MRVIDKIAEKSRNLEGKDNVTLCFFGDSVTQGCFELYKNAPESVETVFDSKNAYHSKVMQIFSVIFPNVPINVINAGISGANTAEGVERLERDVLSHKPDLVVVCFGLNDCTKGTEKVFEYKENLRNIFSGIKKSGAEVIFMTPNMMNTYSVSDISDSYITELQEDICEIFKKGFLELYVNAAREVCAEENVRVCDCYAKWKTLYECGVDTTRLLANFINHPRREMHWLFAYSLVEEMFK